MIGKQQVNSTSRSLAPDLTSVAIEAAMLFLAGAFAMFIHVRVKYGLHIPGNHGLDFMAILMAGRMVSKLRYSSIFMALGIGVMIMLPFMGFKNPVSAIGYMLPVFVLDFIYSNLSENRRKGWLMAVFGGLSYMMVPLFRIILMMLTGLAYPAAIKYGTVLAPIAGFFIFGMLGSGIILGVVKIIKKTEK